MPSRPSERASLLCLARQLHARLATRCHGNRFFPFRSRDLYKFFARRASGRRRRQRRPTGWRRIRWPEWSRRDRPPVTVEWTAKLRRDGGGKLSIMCDFCRSAMHIVQQQLQPEDLHYLQILHGTDMTRHHPFLVHWCRGMPISAANRRLRTYRSLSVLSSDPILYARETHAMLQAASAAAAAACFSRIRHQPVYIA